ncbi:site-specific DNA-methyltransferase [Thioalkalivibrio sp. ALMg13-2]|uniref:site-specific DNA-methyltransferase n=1 Tax=Thioalkalivibrio sp. ALMg13-2 TaxID=1158167 RepID=UPI0009DB2A76|nr:site-specific DNA-methyltransferase [Thioalkalivibrio sp. ALMg13-2]
MVKAFRDTWRDGIHSYLSYLRDRLTVARDLLTDSGSIFVQIGDENVHRVRALMDEIFGDDNFVSEIIVIKSSGLGANTLPRQNDYILMYAKLATALKYRQLFKPKALDGEGAGAYQLAKSTDGVIRRLRKGELEAPGTIPTNLTVLRLGDLTKPGPGSKYEIEFQGKLYSSKSRWWGMPKDTLLRAIKADRVFGSATTLSYQRLLSDWSAFPLTNIWADTGTGSGLNKIYVVQTDEKIVQRCLLMATDPGDLVLDPTCGSGTTATVAEQWGRRWITIDTSRVALALARARIMGARYPYYLLADSRDGQLKESEITRTAPSSQPTRGHIAHGFVYERVPHITLKSIANNAEIDVIWERFQETLEPLRERLNDAVAANWEEWEIPRQSGEEWPEEAKQLHARWWEKRIARQQEIDASIAAKADHEFLYDKPYEDKKKVRVAGPFTVESLSPHRVLGVDENDELIDPAGAEGDGGYSEERDFVQIILENLKTAGVQQAHREDKITFTALTPWPGDLICAEGRYFEGGEETGKEKRAAIFIGPEFGTVSRPDLVAAAREAGDADFDVLITCAFNYDAHSSEFDKLGRVPVLKARMNADLHMAADLKNTGKGNLFVIFGEPDIDIVDAAGPNGTGDGEPGQIQVKVNGVDVFHPNTGEVRSDGADGIACWFIDTDYNEESFFVRHAYFLGANDPYKSLKTTLKAEIDEDAWATLHSDTSRPFAKPKAGRIAVKVINHLGDEVMKVFRV